MCFHTTITMAPKRQRQGGASGASGASTKGKSAAKRQPKQSRQPKQPRQTAAKRSRADPSETGSGKCTHPDPPKEEEQEDGDVIIARSEDRDDDEEEKRALNKMYRKVEHREHVLLRPDMYVGPTRPETRTVWVFDQQEGRMILRPVAYVYALLKVFDEILMNAIDHAVRLKMLREGGTTDVCPVKNIRVDIDDTTGVIEVTNDGEGIDVVAHPESGIYIPELIFGHLLTSTNYDDEGDKERIVGGQNGIGAKACNILSKRFEIETVDKNRKRVYAQTFEDNMSVARPPDIKYCTKKPYTKIRFLPDYERFSQEGGRLSDDMRSLFVKRVYDATAVTDPDVSIFLCGDKIECKSFERYVDLYLGPKDETPRVYERINDRWEIVAACSDGNGMQQVSFVNGVCTLRGGRHVDHVLNIITRRLTEMIQDSKKRSRGAGGNASAGGGEAPASNASAAPSSSSGPLNVRPQYIRDNLFIFVKACVPNPTFDGQTKESLNTPSSQFGGERLEISDRFMKKLMDSPLLERVMALSEASADKSLKKTDGKKQTSINVPKLDDANWAGGAKSAACTLILTEGDSAKTTAIAGLSQQSRDSYGVFPLRGKIMNVCDLQPQRIATNQEIINIKQIVGLESGRDYSKDGVASLRYGRIMVMTDQDVDGSHIKGLLFNLFHRLWPSLLRVPGFLTSMLTPIIKARRSAAMASRRGQEGVTQVEFYNIADFEAWKASGELERGGWEIKYYKGLGTSTKEEAKEYFRALKTVSYVWQDEGTSGDALDLAFNKARANDRKTWLLRYDRTAGLDYGKSDVTFEDFVNRDLVHFSNYDIVRSIPSVCDGFKVSQRKIVFCAFKRNLTKEIKVAQLAGYVSENSAYHHGEVSLNAAIVGIAQDFVGSNNINLLLPNGQFGSRRQGGKDASAARYIYTELNPITQYLLPREDDAVLRYLDDDGMPVEPDFYVPVLPLVLVNGAMGIGTGFSTNVPCYNPEDLARALLDLLDVADRRAERERRGEAEPEDGGDVEADSVTVSSLSPDDPVFALHPWYRGFTGTVEYVGEGKYFTRGRWHKSGPASRPEITITELPIGYWTEDFVETVDAFRKNYPQDVKSVKHNHTDTAVCCTITFSSMATLDAYTRPMSGDRDGDGGSNAQTVVAEGKVPLSRLEKELKLVSNRHMSTTNMYLFNHEGRIQKYDSVRDVLIEYFRVRLHAYARRKAHLLRELAHRAKVLRNKSRFLREVVDGDIVIHRKNKADLEEQLAERGYDSLVPSIVGTAGGLRDGSEGETPGVKESSGGGYDYLTRMPLFTLTLDKKQEVDGQLDDVLARIRATEEVSERNMWRADLEAFRKAYARHAAKRS